MMFIRIVGVIKLALCLIIIDHADSFASVPAPPICSSTVTTYRCCDQTFSSSARAVVSPIETPLSYRTTTRSTALTRWRWQGGSYIDQHHSLKANKNKLIDDNSDAINSINDNKEDKFSFYQRIESIKTAIVGLLSGGILSTPIIALHDIPNYGLASWEFDTDMGSLQSALFAIVYRYCIRQNDDNDMLNMGVVGAFIVVRTLSRIRVPSYCTAAPLDCGDPIGYFDYDMIGQLILNGMESVALFGGAALAMEVAYSKGWITKFPS